MNIYTLSKYVDALEQAGLVKDVNLYGLEDVRVENVTFNSKESSDGTLFICKGAAFKGEYLMQALDAGAFVYVSEIQYEVGGDVPHIIVSDIRKAMPVIAALYYNEPQKDIKIASVTGTKGKSTTSYYIKAIIDDYMAAQGHIDCGITSTIDTYDGVVRLESHNTTPESVEVYKHLRNAVNSGMEYMVMESSSQALKYHRVDGVTFDVGIMLNISEDHISPIEHQDFEDYFSSKLKIYDQSRVGVVNLDAQFFERSLKSAAKCEKVITFSQEKPEADIYGYNVRKAGHEIIFNVRSHSFDEEFKITMPGLFNVENALAAICTAYEFGIPVEYMKSGLYRARSKGRMEAYTTKDGKVIVIVDYAHNKLSFEKLFESTKKEYPDYKISVVFGCPGRKALIRRHDLGVSAGEHADRIYIVPEDPATEDPFAIAEEVADYIKPFNKPYVIINDRGEGLKKAVEDAKEKTVVLITGKGNETRQFIQGVYVDCPSDIDYAIKFVDEYNMKYCN